MALAEPAHSSWLEAEPLFWCPVRELELKCRSQAENEDLEGGNGAHICTMAQDEITGHKQNKDPRWKHQH